MKFDTSMALVVLRGLSTLFATTGQQKTADSLTKVADGVEAGVNVDAHMANVAVALKSGLPRDWDEVHSRIDSDHKLLQGS